MTVVTPVLLPIRVSAPAVGLHPGGSRRPMGEVRLDDGDRYRPDGGDLWFRWRPVSEALAAHWVDTDRSVTTTCTTPS
ncbi:hypothetical protein C9J60_31585 [Streptomyces sp. A244]|nr:hypothetical protein C9J60_31585 [Streptomyces sp. A244]